MPGAFSRPFTTLALVVVVDQMLLPMFHLVGLPFKPSYGLMACMVFLAAMAPIRHVAERAARRDEVRVGASLGLIMLMGWIGELWLSANYAGVAHAEMVRSSVIYALAFLAFVTGRRASSFDPRWLVRVLLVAAGLNIAFIVMGSRTPSWLAALYYPTTAADAIVAEGGFSDLSSFLDFSRPRGLFGNPNVSAHMINILALFIHLFLRNGWLVIRSVLVASAIIMLPIALSVVLASRGEFVVAVVLAVLNFRVLFHEGVRYRTLRRVALSIALPLIVVMGLRATMAQTSYARNLDRVTGLVQALKGTPESEAANVLTRPLLRFDRALARFVLSPLFGTGFGTGNEYPINQSTTGYHNDWFRLLVTSGIVGVFALGYLIRRFAWPIGWPALIPFVLPGLVNTFMLTIPAWIVYFLMLGVLQRRLLEQRQPTVTTARARALGSDPAPA